MAHVRTYDPDLDMECPRCGWWGKAKDADIADVNPGEQPLRCPWCRAGVMKSPMPPYSGPNIATMLRAAVLIALVAVAIAILAFSAPLAKGAEPVVTYQVIVVRSDVFGDLFYFEPTNEVFLPRAALVFDATSPALTVTFAQKEASHETHVRGAGRTAVRRR